MNNPLPKIIISITVGWLFIMLPAEGQAQDNRLIKTHSWEYEYIKRLQQRGHLLQLNPTDLPFAAKDLRQALARAEAKNLNQQEKRWIEMLNESVRPRPTNIDSMRVGGLFEPGLRRSSSERLNVIHPLGNGKPVLPRAEVNGYLEWKNWIGQAGVTFDWFYDIDPDGLDTARRLYTRSEEAYFGYDGDIFDLHVGRFDNHWSVYDRQGGFLTDNPQSFDQIQLKFGSSKLSFSSILGEMDSMNADSTFTGRSYGPGSVRRYLFLHRLDWSPLPNLKLSFIEGELYFSETASISIQNLLPLHLLYISTHNKPRNHDTNLVIGGSLWYNYRSLTFYSQLMIDEITLANREEKKERNKFLPAVYTLNNSLTLTNIANSFDLGLEADFVSTNSYRSGHYRDQWTYAQRGLATNFSDYIRTKLSATFYPHCMEGLKVEPGMTLYWKGTEDFRDLRKFTEPDGSQIPHILAGTVERTLRPSLHLRYQPMGTKVFNPEHDIRFNFWVDADMGVNFVENHNHVSGTTIERFIGLFRIFGQFTF